MKLRTTLLAMGFVLAAQGALALTANEVTAQMLGEGYTYVEVKVGPTQIKVEAVRGSEKVEIVFDAASGEELKRETERASSREMGREGTSVRASSTDFVKGGSSDDGEDEEEDRNGGSSGGADDDGGDDHGSRGSDDAEEDDGEDDDGEDNDDEDDDDDDDDDDDGEDDEGDDD